MFSGTDHEKSPLSDVDSKKKPCIERIPFAKKHLEDIIRRLPDNQGQNI